VFGLAGGGLCHFAVRAVQASGCDDALEVFGTHGVGGIVGNLLTGVFAEQRLGAEDGGGLDGNWHQVVRKQQMFKKINLFKTRLSFLS
jgi:Amt family ammonium transporter